MRAALALLSLCAAAALADTMALKDGRFVDGRPIEKTEAGYRVTYENGTIDVPASLVTEVFREGGEGDWVPTTDEEKAKASKGLVPWKERWVSRQFRESQVKKELAARALRIQQMKERQLWRNHIHVTTRTFEFRTTLPDDIFAEFQDLFETYVDFFGKFWRIRPSTRFGKPVIHIYHDEATYYQVSGAPRGAVGYYVPSTHQLHFYYDREHRDFAIDVMFHEGNHMLTHMVNEKVHYPAWLNEGMAEYFGASTWDPETKTMELGGLQSGRVAGLITYIENGQWMGIETLLKSSATLEVYAWGWSLCHFLMTDARYADRFKKYFLAVGKGDLVKQRAGGPLGQRTVDADEAMRALKSFLRVKDLKELEQQWHAYVKDIIASTKIDPHVAGYIMMLWSRNGTVPQYAKKALEYLKQTIDGGSTNAFDYYNYATLLRHIGRNGAALKRAAEALTHDPLHASARGLMGLCMYFDAQREEGIREIALARELAPDEQQIWYWQLLVEDLEIKRREQGG